MNVNKKIIGALQGFGYPVVQDLYTGKKDHYFVFTYADERGINFSDNRPKQEKASINISLFLPANENYMQLKEDVKKKLIGAGFSYPSAGQYLEQDGRIRHVVFVTEITERI
ncbi:MAG: hypothetical protein K2N01_13350 [Lachnospiraceae bacterium]|nr:hypothetical protein [Lachnospiraceae bacterium]